MKLAGTEPSGRWLSPEAEALYEQFGKLRQELVDAYRPDFEMRFRYREPTPKEAYEYERLIRDDPHFKGLTEKMVDLHCQFWSPIYIVNADDITLTAAPPSPPARPGTD